MSEFAKSLRRSGRLQQLGQGLEGLAAILEENRKKEEQKKFFSTVVDLYDKWKQGQEKAKMKTDLKEGGEVTNVFSPENFMGTRMSNFGNLPKETPIGEVNVPENIKKDVSNLPPEIQTRDVSPKERYEKSQENLSSFLESIVPLVMNPNIDESSISRANVLANLAETQAERLKPPKTTRTQEDPFKRTLVKDEFGDVISREEAETKPSTANTEEYERDEKGNYKVYTIKGQNYYNKITKNAQGQQIKEGLTRIPKEGEGKTTINLPGENKLSPTTAKLIADLKNFKPYTVNKDGKQIPMDSKDIKYAKDTALENIKLQLLSNPRAYEFVTNIETLWKEGDPTGSREYLSPKELYNETLKHAKTGDIDEEVQDQIATYLRYYSKDIYNGLTTQPEGK